MWDSRPKAPRLLLHATRISSWQLNNSWDNWIIDQLCYFCCLWSLCIIYAEDSIYFDVKAFMQDCSEEDSDDDGLVTHCSKPRSVSLNIKAWTIACWLSWRIWSWKSPPTPNDPTLSEKLLSPPKFDTLSKSDDEEYEEDEDDSLLLSTLELPNQPMVCFFLLVNLRGDDELIIAVCVLIGPVPAQPQFIVGIVSR